MHKTKNSEPLKLIILDRDGVINEDSDEYVKSTDEWIPLPGSIQAIADLSNAGYTICIATNQSGLAREYFTSDTLDDMHKKMCGLVEEAGGTIHTIKHCPHGPSDNCNCRKPLPGMFEEIAMQFNLTDLSGTYTVGDSARDLYAGSTLNSLPILVRTGKGERTILKGDFPKHTEIHDDLAAFSRSILNKDTDKYFT